MRDRTLNRLKVEQVPWVQTYTRANGTFCTQYTGLAPCINGSYSHMIDAGSRRSDNFRTRYLEHFRCTIQSYLNDYVMTYDGGSCGVGTAVHHVGYSDPGYLITGYDPWAVGSEETNQAILEAFRFFESGCVDQEVLLANFAWELPDVRSLWPSFKNLFRNKGKSTLAGKIPDVKATSGSYLAYEFGIKPIISDCIRAYERLRDLDNHIAWLRKNSGKMTKVEFNKELRQITATIHLPVRPNYTPYGFSRNVRKLKAGFKAWAIVTYDVSALSNIQLKVRTLMRTFGLNNPAAVLWEAIPYSFVYDWFTNIGKLLDILEIPIKLPCVFHDCGHAVWVESSFDDLWTSDGITVRLRTTDTRGYSRRPGLPLNISGPLLESPTAKQLVLGLALIGQKS